MIYFVISVIIVGFICVIISMIKSGQPVRNAFISIIQGILSLIAVNVTGLITGVTVSVNWYTLAFVSAFGMPATIMLTLIRFIFR